MSTFKSISCQLLCKLNNIDIHHQVSSNFHFTYNNGIEQKSIKCLQPNNNYKLFLESDYETVIKLKINKNDKSVFPRKIQLLLERDDEQQLKKAYGRLIIDISNFYGKKDFTNIIQDMESAHNIPPTFNGSFKIFQEEELSSDEEEPNDKTPEFKLSPSQWDFSDDEFSIDNSATTLAEEMEIYRKSQEIYKQKYQEQMDFLFKINNLKSQEIETSNLPPKESFNEPKVKDTTIQKESSLNAQEAEDTTVQESSLTSPEIENTTVQKESLFKEQEVKDTTIQKESSLNAQEVKDTTVQESSLTSPEAEDTTVQESSPTSPKAENTTIQESSPTSPEVEDTTIQKESSLKEQEVEDTTAQKEESQFDNEDPLVCVNDNIQEAIELDREIKLEEQERQKIIKESNGRKSIGNIAVPLILIPNHVKRQRRVTFHFADKASIILQLNDNAPSFMPLNQSTHHSRTPIPTIPIKAKDDFLINKNLISPQNSIDDQTVNALAENALKENINQIKSNNSLENHLTEHFSQEQPNQRLLPPLSEITTKDAFPKIDINNQNVVKNIEQIQQSSKNSEEESSDDDDDSPININVSTTDSDTEEDTTKPTQTEQKPKEENANQNDEPEPFPSLARNLNQVPKLSNYINPEQQEKRPRTKRRSSSMNIKELPEDIQQKILKEDVNASNISVDYEYEYEEDFAEEEKLHRAQRELEHKREEEKMANDPVYLLTVILKTQWRTLVNPPSLAEDKSFPGQVFPLFATMIHTRMLKNESPIKFFEKCKQIIEQNIAKLPATRGDLFITLLSLVLLIRTQKKKYGFEFKRCDSILKVLAPIIDKVLLSLLQRPLEKANLLIDKFLYTEFDQTKLLKEFQELFRTTIEGLVYGKVINKFLTSRFTEILESNIVNKIISKPENFTFPNGTKWYSFLTALDNDYQIVLPTLLEFCRIFVMIQAISTNPDSISDICPNIPPPLVSFIITNFKKDETIQTLPSPRVINKKLQIKGAPKVYEHFQTKKTTLTMEVVNSSFHLDNWNEIQPNEANVRAFSFLSQYLKKNTMS